MDLINSSDYVVADGTGVVKASKRLNQPLRRRVPGIELLEECLKIAHANHQRVYLLGSKMKLSKRLNVNYIKYSNVTFAYHHGYINLRGMKRWSKE